MKLGHRHSARPGAVLLEGALCILALVILIIGMLDVAIGVFRHNTISQATRHGCRQAIVHGEKAPTGWNGGRWKPGDDDTITITNIATDGSPQGEAIRPMLVGCDLTETTATITWLESSDQVAYDFDSAGNPTPTRRVRVTITTTYRPVLTSIFGASPITLTASSTMQIAH